MAATKLFDAVVKTGEYTNGNNEVKGRYENVGSIMQGENGMFLILKRTFNAAGVPNPDNKDSVIVSFFEADNNKQGQQPQQNGFNQQQQQTPQQNGGFGQQQQQAPQQQQNGGYNQHRS